MFDKIFKHKILSCDEIVNVIGLNKKAQASYIWALFCVSEKSIIITTNTLYEANMLYKSLSYYDSSNVLFYPMDDFLVSEALAVSPDLMSKRIETLNELVNSNSYKKILVTNLMGYLRFLPDKELWNSLKIDIKRNQEFSRDNLIQRLEIMGYKRTSIVTKTGEYANRGYILDIFPYGEENPLRIEFFDDEVEEIRYFEPETQLSTGKKEIISIYPFTEFINEKQKEDIPERQSLLPRVVNKVSNISEYLNEKYYSIFIDLDGIKVSYNRLLEDIVEFRESDKFDIENYMHDLNDLIPVSYVNLSSVDNYNKKNIVEEYKTVEIDKFNGNFHLLNNFLLKLYNDKKRIIVCLEDKKMIDDFISNVDLKCVITNFDDLKPDLINVVKSKIDNGFIINNDVFLSSNEIYKRNQNITYRSKFRYGSKIKDINKLQIGDYIVHTAFGIGKYLGIVTLNPKGLKKDYIHLQYKDNDKLYIPVEKIEYISKYSSNEGLMPKLSKLGGTDWVKQKARVKGKVKDIAKELLETSAKRKLLPGFAFLQDDEEQFDFEQSFMYEPTPDQIRAINDIKEDMQMPYPMDRLLCGDVGYGKTEVAFRAIFKAIKSGKQVAFLCPTTILSKQHYENAKERFLGYGINIEVINRFITPKKKEEILKNIKSGKTDLIIGTHSLLSKEIVYKDLGLLVIDEEQRFGVTHKEKIKELQKNIDVLTLSATPIPRTLQMSLSGVRGLSLIETPPAFRNPIQTYVLRENDQVIKDAIYKELSREGQVFILYNNVSNIEQMMQRIKKLVPEADINYIHGQMNKTEIEDTMDKFISNDFNVLICTTIIETGIDIENANTLIVLDSDYFGLSQLYQIRGRIGRGKNIAYAYLMYNKNKELNDIAKKRLDAIKEFTELGSGYALAVRDLSIRGAGNILGSEQSGFIDAVGYDLYLKILNEEVERLKGNITEEEKLILDEKPLLQVSTHISEKYADSGDLKIEIHKKINTIDSYLKFEEVKEELEDRFGKLDEDIIVYMKEELFEVIAKQKDVLKIEQMPNRIITYFSKEKSQSINGTDLLVNLFNITSNFSVQYNNQILKVILDLKNLDEHFINYMIKMIDVIE